MPLYKPRTPSVPSMCLNVPNRLVVYTRLLPAAPSNCFRRRTRSNGNVTATSYEKQKKQLMSTCCRHWFFSWYIHFSWHCLKKLPALMTNNSSNHAPTKCNSKNKCNRDEKGGWRGLGGESKFHKSKTDMERRNSWQEVPCTTGMKLSRQLQTLAIQRNHYFEKKVIMM